MIKQIFRRPYLYWFLGIFLAYLTLNVLLSGFYNTIPLIFIYAKTVNWLKLGLSLILTFIIGFLVSLNTILIYVKYKERKKCKGMGIASAGATAGLVVGVCPLCVSGILPLILGFLGIGFSFASLPFGGIEVQVLVVLVLYYSYKVMSRS